MKVLKILILLKNFLIKIKLSITYIKNVLYKLKRLQEINNLINFDNIQFFH
jgi:hypothetical protein